MGEEEASLRRGFSQRCVPGRDCTHGGVLTNSETGKMEVYPTYKPQRGGIYGYTSGCTSGCIRSGTYQGVPQGVYRVLHTRVYLRGGIYTRRCTYRVYLRVYGKDTYQGVPQGIQGGIYREVYLRVVYRHIQGGIPQGGVPWAYREVYPRWCIPGHTGRYTLGGVHARYTPEDGHLGVPFGYSRFTVVSSQVSLPSRFTVGQSSGLSPFLPASLLASSQLLHSRFTVGGQFLSAWESCWE